MKNISDRAFGIVQRFLRGSAGIALAPAKKALVVGRLSRRIEERHFEGYTDYVKLVASGDDPAETQVAVDLLTTNETSFFREAKHFEALRIEALAARGRSAGFRVWSAACSSGEEVYSIAMILADCLERSSWQVLGSDISARVLARARMAHYPMAGAQNIPAYYLKRFCLKGVGPQDGTLLIERELRERVELRQVNLIKPIPALGSFDVIFLRNVLIYFDKETKRQVVAAVLRFLRPGGRLFIGHSETLHELSSEVESVAPSQYRKPSAACRTDPA